MMTTSPRLSVGRVTDEAHFTDDLGADWLDRLDLMIAVEDQFAGVEITDDDVDRIELVGDLIRHIETLDSERRRRGAAPVFRNLFGPHVARAMKPTKQQEGDDVFLRLAGDAMRIIGAAALRRGDAKPDAFETFAHAWAVQPIAHGPG